MQDLFVNPITMGFQLLKVYRGMLADVLREADILDEQIQHILSEMEIDKGIFFSINRKYKVAEEAFRDFCENQCLHPLIPEAFPRIKRLFQHQVNAIHSIMEEKATIVSTGTGSGKTETFLIPIMNHCLTEKAPGIKAIIIYPMNALANDQLQRIAECAEYTNLTFGCYTGATPENAARNKDGIERINRNHYIYREEMIDNPPDILITNYVMLDRILTHHKANTMLKKSSHTLKYIILDEIHTYRGSKATHLKYLLRRLKFLLKTKTVQIGLSATLAKDEKNGKDGYLLANDNLSEFITKLLDVDKQDYSLITPIYAPEMLTADPSLPIQKGSFGWDLRVTQKEGLEKAGQLLGKKYSYFTNMSAPRFEETEIYQDFQRHPFVVALKKALLEKPLNFHDMNQILYKLLPATESEKTEELVKAFLSTISFLNEFSENKPLLDFRIHLFVKNIGGLLKRCIKCGKYHSGAQDYCQNCGFLLFPVYKQDITKCVGKMSGSLLKNHLYRESDDRKNSYFVLLSVKSSEQRIEEGLLSIKNDSRIENNSITIDYDLMGKWQLELLHGYDYDNIDSCLLKLIDGKKDYQYIHYMIKKLLDFQYSGEKQVLSFIDNREKANQYAIVLNDEFASALFLECLQLYYPQERQLSIEEALSYLLKKIEVTETADYKEKKVFQELILWFLRFISVPVRIAEMEKDYIELKNREQFSEFENELLNIFIQERAINKSSLLPMLTLQPEKHEYIRFDKFYATTHRGINIESVQVKNTDPSYTNISLGSNAQNYKSFVAEHGEQISEGVDSLARKGVLKRKDLPDGRVLYFLKAKFLYFKLQPSKFTDIEELKETHLYTTATHNSEIKKPELLKVEKYFRKQSLNVLISTPTLEMGIDIGGLQNVMMIGVPPLPSNYSQRAGRAGRGKRKYALLVTMCFEDKNHDMYYFENPLKMIEGVISPPVFNELNKKIIYKHIHALLFSNDSSGSLLESYISRLENGEIPHEQDIYTVFGKRTWITDYLQHQLKEELKNIQEQHKLSRNAYVDFYKIGFFPDYSFRKEQVDVIDEKEYKKALQVDPEEKIEEYTLSTREQELAYYKFPPGERVFMAGNMYKITANGEFKTIPQEKLPVRSYQYLTAVLDEHLPSREKVKKSYDLVNEFRFGSMKKIHPIHKQKKAIQFYLDYVGLSFLNNGVVKFKTIEPFEDENGTEFAMGYHLERLGIIIEFDRMICDEPSYALSLASALDRTIKDEYGLDESEIRLLFDVKQQGEQDAAKLYLILYDYDGNGNVPFVKIFQHFQEMLQRAHNKLVDCSCKEGCYICLKSYNTHIYAQEIKKDVAMMLLGYLLGKNPFQPSMPEQEKNINHFDLMLQIYKQEGFIIVESERAKYQEPIETSQNKTIFDLIRKAVLAEFNNDMKSLKLRFKEKYLVDAINEGNVKSDKEAFSQLQFELLRFKHIRAEKL